MPWLPFYAADSDLPEVLAHINASEELAFVVSDGPGKWIAVRHIESLQFGRHCVWHVPSGPLPLFRGAQEQPGEITDPFSGWREMKPGADPSTPYFGAGHPGVFWLNVRPGSFFQTSGEIMVGLSSFEWIGNHYKAIGSPAKVETERCWKALCRWIKKYTVKVPRGGLRQQTPPEVWTFGGAHALFELGAKGGNV